MPKEVAGADVVRGLQRMLADKLEIYRLVAELKKLADQDPVGWKRLLSRSTWRLIRGGKRW